MAKRRKKSGCHVVTVGGVTPWATYRVSSRQDGKKLIAALATTCDVAMIASDGGKVLAVYHCSTGRPIEVEFTD